MIILEVQAEGLPRYVGPFGSRAAADNWAGVNIRDGSWSLIEPVAPAALYAEGKR